MEKRGVGGWERGCGGRQPIRHAQTPRTTPRKGVPLRWVVPGGGQGTTEPIRRNYTARIVTVASASPKQKILPHPTPPKLAWGTKKVAFCDPNMGSALTALAESTMAKCVQEYYGKVGGAGDDDDDGARWYKME